MEKTASQIAEETFPYIEGDSQQGRYNIFTRRDGFCIGYNFAQSQLADLKKENDTLTDGLEEISEVTVMQDNYKEAFEIVQNIVNHLINKTER